MAAINPIILEKNFTTKPKVVSSHILSLCANIISTYAPFEVDVIADEKAVISECFPNVMNKIVRDGGSILYGWSIWEWSGVFIEAEHHAIWEKDSIYTDITPHRNGENKILFLPDPKRVYDFRSEKRLPNVRRSFGVLASVIPWIDICNEFDDAIERNSVGREVYDHPELNRLGVMRVEAQARIIIELSKTTRVNDKCICTSGKKFKKCCAPLIQQ